MKMGIFLAIMIIVILEILRYFRDVKRTITEIDELKSRVEYLESTMKQK